MCSSFSSALRARYSTTRWPSEPTPGETVSDGSGVTTSAPVPPSAAAYDVPAVEGYDWTDADRAMLHRGRPWDYKKERSMVRTTISATDVDGLAEVRPPVLH